MYMKLSILKSEDILFLRVKQVFLNKESEGLGGVEEMSADEWMGGEESVP